MNKMRKNLKKIVSCLALVVAMLVTSVPAHAAGIEDWNYGTGPEENIRVTNNNLTPVKTITHTGTLTIEYLTLPCKPGYSHCGCSDSEPFSYPAVKATVQIREAYTGRVLATSTTNEMDFNAKVSAYVTAGSKIQVFFDVSTIDGQPKPGPYRKAHFSYYYTLY